MIPIEDLRVRAGLAASDTSKDNELIIADDIANALMEAWLDRKLPQLVDTEVFTHFDGTVISLRRYPITPGTVVISGSFSHLDYHVDAERGLIQFDGRVHEHQITVAYEGGYTALPPALYGVALLLFDDVYAVTTKAGTGQLGDIRSITIPDVGTIQFATGGSGAKVSETLPGMDYGIPAQWGGIIDLYRRLHA